MLDRKKQERSIYCKRFLDDTFFGEWRIPKEKRTQREFYSNLEIIVTPDCNLACTYCYVRRHSAKLYPEEIKNLDDIRNNTSLLVEWLIENKLVPNAIELFSGSLFSQQVGWDVLEILYNKYSSVGEELRPFEIVIPTNFTFLIDDETTKRVEDIFHRFQNIGIRFHLSGSVEGKYMEQNRPFKQNLKLGTGTNEHIYIPNSKEPRDDEYYEKVFAFCKKYKFGLHPMVYSRNIENWKQNYVWFQEMLKKHKIRFNSFMMLEVRNEEWTEKQLAEFSSFIEFAVDYVFKNIFKENKKDFLKFMKEEMVVKSIFDSCFSKNILTGISCSIQQAVYVRAGDLHIVPCHRTSYTGLEYGKFVTSDNKIVDIEGLNIELMTQILTFDHRTLSMCENCVIKEVCNQTCLGANLESTGELFAPPPSVCRLSYARILGAVRAIKNIGLEEEIPLQANRNQSMTYWLLFNKIIGGDANEQK